MKNRTTPSWSLFLLLAACLATAPLQAAEGDARLSLEKGDHICLVGSALAERMQHMGHVETALHARFPELELVVRNLGWSGDELTLRPRSKDFGDMADHLGRLEADVVFAFFGFNESFAGADGLAKFEKDLADFIESMKAARFNGESAPRLVLFSPTAFENLHDRDLPDGAEANGNLALYSEAMAKVARAHQVPFVDLFGPTRELTAPADEALTINGVHLSDEGYRRLAPVLIEGLFGPAATDAAGTPDLETLRAAVNEKNLQFWHRHRAVNGYYIYGGRKNPFGVRNFPQEMQKLDEMTANRDRRVWAIAGGQTVPAEIDDGNTVALAAMETNYNAPIEYLAPDEAREQFTVADGYEVNLFASEADFPELRNPCQFAFDARGRLWVCTMPSYPQYLPGTPPDDKLLILEDVDGDGKADKSTVFADGLHVPTGFELGDGGVYIAQQPNLVFLEDLDGDDHADRREIVLHGFDSADSHHSISAFTWGPGGGLYFQEGTFHHSQVETPHGPVRCEEAGVFRYEPRTEKLDVFVSYRFANPWGHVFDRWGQNFVADASGGSNYYGTAFSGHVDYPRKHGRLKEFTNTKVRPTSGCEIVASRNFPEEAQGNFVLNNTIGFQGVKQYQMKENGSGFDGIEVEPLLVSSDRNFRPVDIEFGLDGALYLVDWYNPLVGHMQHSLRDPNRDHAHGRIWRIHYKSRPLVERPRIAGEPIPALLELLKSYEDRTRSHVRGELRERDADEVVAAIEQWIAALDPQDADHEHHLLEALWVHQHLNVVDESLLSRLLRSPDYRARAAATRVLGYWRDRVADPLDLLMAQAVDEHPRVRLEAVRAASFFTDVKAADVALASLAHPQDEYLEYTLKETMDTLDRYLRAPQE